MGKNDNKPRGRMSAYAFFVQTFREEEKEKNPDQSVVFGEFSRRCADTWKAMSGNEKTRFQLMAEQDKERYESETANYKPTESKKRKKAKDPNAPKRSLSSFILFSNDERPKVKETLPDSTIVDVAKELGKRWNEASSDVRSKYEAIAANEKLRYRKEVETYEDNKQKREVPSSSKKNERE